MPSPTLVVSNPPHGEVDIAAAAELLQLDVYATRLKAVFKAPEIMEASSPGEAAAFAAALRGTGFNVAVLPGRVLAEVPWPGPVSNLVLDSSSLQVTVGSDTLRIPLAAEVLGVHCRPPEAPPKRSAVNLERAIASEHGPTVAEAIGRRSVLDLYFRDGPALRRATVIPDRLQLDEERLVKNLVRRLNGLRLDGRLVGVRPRGPFVPGGEGAVPAGPERRRYSFGTVMLYRALESIAPELRAVPQYELGSRLACALGPLGGGAAAH
ncbi:MAG TPA: hypothetical protein VMN39_08720 [Longimicrobiaceae bacterium]|nr:hypothetical protein [Longimicrobiaceae bacterium]